MKKKPRVIILISGGVLCDVHSDIPLDVHLCDEDDKQEEGFSKDQIERSWKRRTRGMIAVY